MPLSVGALAPLLLSGERADQPLRLASGADDPALLGVSDRHLGDVSQPDISAAGGGRSTRPVVAANVSTPVWRLRDLTTPCSLAADATRSGRHIPQRAHGWMVSAPSVPSTTSPAARLVGQADGHDCVSPRHARSGTPAGAGRPCGSRRCRSTRTLLSLRRGIPGPCVAACRATIAARTETRPARRPLGRMPLPIERLGKPVARGTRHEATARLAPTLPMTTSNSDSWLTSRSRA